MFKLIATKSRGYTRLSALQLLDPLFNDIETPERIADEFYLKTKESNPSDLLNLIFNHMKPDNEFSPITLPFNRGIKYIEAVLKGNKHFNTIHAEPVDNMIFTILDVIDCAPIFPAEDSFRLIELLVKYKVPLSNSEIGFSPGIDKSKESSLEIGGILLDVKIAKLLCKQDYLKHLWSVNYFIQLVTKILFATRHLNKTNTDMVQRNIQEIFDLGCDINPSHKRLMIGLIAYIDGTDVNYDKETSKNVMKFILDNATDEPYYYRTAVKKYFLTSKEQHTPPEDSSYWREPPPHPTQLQTNTMIPPGEDDPTWESLKRIEAGLGAPKTYKECDRRLQDSFEDYSKEILDPSFISKLRRLINEAAEDVCWVRLPMFPDLHYPVPTHKFNEGQVAEMESMLDTVMTHLQNYAGDKFNLDMALFHGYIMPNDADEYISGKGKRRAAVFVETPIGGMLSHGLMHHYLTVLRALLLPNVLDNTNAKNILDRMVNTPFWNDVTDSAYSFKPMETPYASTCYTLEKAVNAGKSRSLLSNFVLLFHFLGLTIQNKYPISSLGESCSEAMINHILLGNTLPHPRDLPPLTPLTPLTWKIAFLNPIFAVPGGIQER